MVDDPVGSLADALVAAQSSDIGACLDLFHRLFSLFSALSQLLVDLLISGQQVLLLCDLQQCHAGAGVLFCGGTHLGSKALAGLMDLAQVGVQAHALHLQLLLDLLHLLLVSGLHQHAGQFALGGIGQLGQDLILGAVQSAGVLAVV